MLNLFQLRYFVDAAKSGSLSEAAKKNRVSQSAVSQAIRSLERSLGFHLITHQKKRFQLTDQGKAVLLESDQVFRSVSALTDAIQQISSGYSGSISLGCTHTIATGFLPPVLANLCREHPRLRPMVRIGNSETIKDWLYQGEIDLGLLVDDDRLTRDFRAQPIRSGHYVLFRAKHAVATKASGLIVTRKEREEVQYYLRNLPRASLPSEIHCEITSWEAIKAYVECSRELGICPDYVVESELEKGRLIAVKTGFKSPKYKLVGISLARNPLGKNAQLLLDTIVANHRSISS